jgi:hypothetical protein
MDHTQVMEVLNRPLAQELLNSNIPVRLAYIARDGSPRAIPIGFLWNGEAFVVCTSTIAAKVPAIQANPQVALTIDTVEFPPKILLVRGMATLEIVDGVPDDYLKASQKWFDEEAMPEFEANVRALYEQMARIEIEPTWAKLIDFDTTLPSAVEELIKIRFGSHPEA